MALGSDDDGLDYCKMEVEERDPDGISFSLVRGSKTSWEMRCRD